MIPRRILLVSMLGIVAVALAAVLGSVLSNTSPTLGLDLQGGFSVTLAAREVNGRLPSEEAVEKAKDIIRQRVDGLGVAEPDIVRQGRTVIVQLPGVTDQSKAEKVVGCTAKLEFRPVLASIPNPDAQSKVSGSTTTTAPGATTTTTAAGSTTTAAPTTTTEAPGTSSTETGMGSVGIAPGEGALPRQAAPTTTTTAPPTTTTTPPPTTTTLPATTTTVAPGGTTTTTIPATGGGTGATGAGGCRSGKPLSAAAITAAQAAIPPGQNGDAFVASKDESTIFVLGPIGFTGDALSSATAALSEEWQVNVSVKGSRKTQANAAFNACYNAEATCPPQQQGGRGAIAIVLDGQVLSAPQVNGADLASDNFTISGSFSQSEAKDLALVLRYGSLPVEFKIETLSQVSATLGKDSLHAGLIAGIIGIAAVALYMVLYYRGLGLVVIAGLTVWGGLMYGLVCWLSANQGLALTLSGIIGIVVSVGTTVDSYVVFFERLKDEVRGGRSVRNSTERGFASAYRTILTADIASFLGAFLLWWLTVGSVRGFAFFLGLSVLLDLVVAYCFTRPAVILLGRSKRLTDARFFGLASALDRAPQTTGAAQ